VRLESESDCMAMGGDVAGNARSGSS